MNAVRPQLLWFGTPPSTQASAACEERGIIIAPRDARPTPGEFSSARGIIFSLPQGLDGTAFATSYGYTAAVASVKTETFDFLVIASTGTEHLSVD
jgi:hypothetical protein